MTKRVMFDSNTWRQIASPASYPKDNHAATYSSLNKVIGSCHLDAYISETTIAIEQIKRADRLDWIKTATQYSRPVDVPGMPWVSGYAIGLLPSKTVEPVAAEVVKRHLGDAARIGMKILKVDRAAYPESSLLAALPNSNIVVEYPRKDSLMRQLFLEIERSGRGLANLKELGEKHTTEEVGIHWSDGIAALDPSCGNHVADLFGEWADGDAVAAAIGHELDIFCTLDKANGASAANVKSILAEDFRAELTRAYGITFLTPKELLDCLKND